VFKRLFGRDKTPPASPAHPRGPAWGQAQTPYQDYFNLHLHGIDAERLTPILRRTYLVSAQKGRPSILLAPAGAWITAFVEPELARRVGFNRLASETAHEIDDWVIAYRIYANEGMDVHYFHSANHLDQLALSEDMLAFEPSTAGLFGSLADVSALIPRSPEQHPLDFHFSLLAALGIGAAALTWDEALARHRAGTLGRTRGDSHLLDG
jgi:hypothetical protein